eukprot:g3788.t1
MSSEILKLNLKTNQLEEKDHQPAANRNPKNRTSSAGYWAKQKAPRQPRKRREETLRWTLEKKALHDVAANRLWGLAVAAGSSCEALRSSCLPNEFRTSERTNKQTETKQRHLLKEPDVGRGNILEQQAWKQWSATSVRSAAAKPATVITG